MPTKIPSSGLQVASAGTVTQRDGSLS